jgi:hypothetical protein
MYSTLFVLLMNEANLVEGCVRSGLSALKKSNSVDRGSLYAALFAYSIGLERLFKLSLILDHCVRCKGTFPTHAEIKSFGHDLKTLYSSAKKAVDRHKIEVPESCRIDDLDERLLDLLTGFAMSGRYFNLDALTGGGKSVDPLPEWGRLLFEVYERDLPSVRRLSNEEQVEALANSLRESIIFAPGVDFTGAAQSYDAFCHDHGKIVLVMPEVVWRFARILYPFQMLMFELDEPLHSGRAGNPTDFPHLWEVCAFCSPNKEETLAEINSLQ